MRITRRSLCARTLRGGGDEIREVRTGWVSEAERAQMKDERGRQQGEHHQSGFGPKQAPFASSPATRCHESPLCDSQSLGSQLSILRQMQQDGPWVTRFCRSPCWRRWGRNPSPAHCTTSASFRLPLRHTAEPRVSLSSLSRNRLTKCLKPCPPRKVLSLVTQISH